MGICTTIPEPATTLLLTAREAARALAVSERTLWQLTSDGQLPAARLGKRSVRYSLSDLREFIERQKQTAAL